MSDKTNLYNLNFDELTEFITNLGQPTFRAQQVWDWLYKRYALDFETMGNIPKAFRAQLAEAPLYKLDRWWMRFIPATAVPKSVV
ncbi:MAG: hypothetical protein M5U34_43950 [Chloroflexi bacterium]|nr:hypothetical protein [Chloroflexota bacterium]